MTIEIEADLDASGEIVDWRHSIWGNGHTARPGRADQPALLAATEIAKPFPRDISINPPPAKGGGSDRNSIPLYDFPSWQSNPIASRPCRSAPLRYERLARRAMCSRSNPFSTNWRLSAEKIRSPSGCVICRIHGRKDVIQAAARRANWKPAKQDGTGYGIGFSRYKNTGAYCAAVAEVEVGEDIRVKRLTLAVDVGEAINPDGVINQIEGGAIQATSWVLKERVRFDIHAHHQQYLDRVSDPALLRGAGCGCRNHLAAGSGFRRCRRSCTWPGDGRDRERRVRCARGAPSPPADHAR